jgi:hypothetical protein
LQLEQYREVSDARAALTADNSPQSLGSMQAALKEVEILCQRSYGDLLTALSPDGAASLRAHLIRVKGKMKVFPPANM